ncbi:MAG: septal ring lytic transglycosylase RlpA family protein [Pseudomonadales bacterium]|nr:septal ring lytic transglycosylase RlpA family protein [Pseudomonadales bacterium]
MILSRYSIVSALFTCCLLVSCASEPLRRPAPSSGQSAGEAGVSNVPAKKYTRGNKSPYVVFGKTYEVMPTSLGYREIGIASWYGKKFHGRLTSNGEVYDMYKLTAAHKALPLPTIVRVTNLDNGKKVTVRVNDRGPFHDDRVIDLSYQTAVALGFADKGTAPVVIEALDELNFPEQFAEQEVSHKSWYLQIGAFSRKAGAEQLLAQIAAVIEDHSLEVQGQILQSELETGLLHKVWLGPMTSEARRDEIAELVKASNLGLPLKVEVE